MLGRIGVIALNMYREAVRARILLGLAGLALATALYSIVVGEFALKNAPRVVSDLGAASISLYAIVVAIVIGATSLYRELEMKTIFPILARPIAREEYVVGKFLGILLTLGVFIALDASAVLFILARHGGRSLSVVVPSALGIVACVGVAMWRVPRWRTWALIPGTAVALVVAFFLASGAPDERRVVVGSSILALLEVGIITSITMVFSSFSSPFLTAVFTLGLFFVGRDADTLAHLPARFFGTAIKSMGEALARVVPNLQVYVPPRPLLTGETPDASLWAHIGLASAQSLAWCTALLVLATWIFRRRDFL